MEPAEELFAPETNQILPEPPGTLQEAAAILTVPEFSKTSVTPTVQDQQETAVLPVQVFPLLSPGDTEHPEIQETSVSVTSTLPSVQTSFPLNLGVSSVPPVLPPPTQRPQPEVEQLPTSTDLLAVLLSTLTRISTLDFSE